MTKNSKSILVLMAALLVLPIPAQAKKEPITLKATSKWNVNYAEDRCRLARQFGDGDQAVVLFFDRFGPGDSFRLTFGGKPVKIFSPQNDVSLKFGPDEQEQTVPFFQGVLKGNMPALFGKSQMKVFAPIPEDEKLREQADVWLNTVSTPIDPVRLSAIRYLSITKPLRQPLLLSTGSMRAPFAALNECINELITHWGIDIEKHKTLTRFATPLKSPGEWILSSDYPLKMLDEGQPSIVEFRLDVGIDGKPTGCHIQLTTRPKEFDSAVCNALMRRARFLPALDTDGQPLPSYWQSTVRFQYEGF
jgi:Gram-negative bacterial TonB protein C-terminal